MLPSREATGSGSGAASFNKRRKVNPFFSSVFSLLLCSGRPWRRGESAEQRGCWSALCWLPCKNCEADGESSSGRPWRRGVEEELLVVFIFCKVEVRCSAADLCDTGCGHGCCRDLWPVWPPCFLLPCGGLPSWALELDRSPSPSGLSREVLIRLASEVLRRR